ncbi:MAG: hypothetical protein RL078_454, partial [Bacteroidota bacterium]
MSSGEASTPTHSDQQWPRARRLSRLRASNRSDPLASLQSQRAASSQTSLNRRAAQSLLETIAEEFDIEDGDAHAPNMFAAPEEDVLENEAFQAAPLLTIHDPPPMQTKLIDLPLPDFHHLLCVKDTLDFIPEACVLKVRECYVMVMRKIIDNPQDVSWWLKLFSLPKVLLSHPNTTNDDRSTLSKQRKDNILAKTTLILADDWSSFTLGSLPINNKKRAQLTKPQIDALQMRKVEEFAKVGELGKAMKLCAADSFRPCEASHDTIRKLRDLHPHPCGYSINPNVLERMKSQVIRSSSREIFDLNGVKVRKLVKKKASKVAPGLDGFRWEHLRALFGQGRPEIPSEEVFAELFTSILVLLIDVKDVPSDVYKFLRLNKLVAIPKPDDSIRPIGMGSIFRKLCSSIIFTQTFSSHADFDGNPFNESYFKNLQYGVDERGCEKILLCFQQYLQLHPDHDLLCCDARNAFNSLSRLKGLEETFKYFKDLIPFMNKMYLEESFGCYYGLAEGVQKIESREGFHQGCILACWLFSMAFHPFLKQLSDIMETDGLVKAFVDDTTIAGTKTKILEALQVISAEGESIGFKLNVNKSVILLGRTETDAEALAKKSEYMTLGFSESCILIHPDNLPGSSASYGTKLLGCFIGHEDFIRSRIQAKAEKLKKIAGNMQKKVDSKQIQFLLLGQCFNAKVNYLSRTTSPDRMLPLLNEFESMKKTILEN